MIRRLKKMYNNNNKIIQIVKEERNFIVKEDWNPIGGLGREGKI